MLKEEIGEEDIADIVSADQAVASKILKIANSAFYGFTRKIQTIPHAIVVIGFNGINNIILNMSVLGLFKENEKVPIEFINKCINHKDGEPYTKIVIDISYFNKTNL